MIMVITRTPSVRAARLGAEQQKIQETTPKTATGSGQGLQDGHVCSRAYLNLHGRGLIAMRAAASLTLGSCQMHEVTSFVCGKRSAVAIAMPRR